MAIYGIGSHFGAKNDMSNKFIADGLAGSNWEQWEAPDVHQMIVSLKVGDIIFIKSFAASSPSIFIGAIGFIRDAEILTSTHYSYIEIGRNVLWKLTTEFSIKKPAGKNNVRLNTITRNFIPTFKRPFSKSCFN